MQTPRRDNLEDIAATATPRPADHPNAVHPTVKLADRNTVTSEEVIPRLLQPTTANRLMEAGLEILAERAKEYDGALVGERSIESVVTAWNALTGRDLGLPTGPMTEAEGWLFMQLLKARRLFLAPGFHRDSAVDGLNYAALTGEAKAREAGL